LKKIIKIMMFCIVMVILIAGCGTDNKSGHKSNNNNVDKVLNQQVNNADKNTTTNASNTDNSGTTNDPVTDNTTNGEEEQTYTLLKDSNDDSAPTSDDTSKSDTQVDYDLTTMGSDMVYATVYQLMVNPDEYVGKTFKMNGLYCPSYYEPTSKYYNYCIIKDAMACCAQGLEFVCEDKSYTYPYDYPAENAQITVTGTFETYQEEGDTSLYCRLSNATMEVEK
jgi:hypothetical protein